MAHPSLAVRSGQDVQPYKSHRNEMAHIPPVCYKLKMFFNKMFFLWNFQFSFMFIQWGLTHCVRQRLFVFISIFHHLFVWHSWMKTCPDTFEVCSQAVNNIVVQRLIILLNHEHIKYTSSEGFIIFSRNNTRLRLSIDLISIHLGIF